MMKWVAVGRIDDDRTDEEEARARGSVVVKMRRDMVVIEYS